MGVQAAGCAVLAVAALAAVSGGQQSMSSLPPAPPQWTSAPVQPADEAAALASLVVVSNGDTVDLLSIGTGPEGMEPPPRRRRLTPIDAAGPADVRLDDLTGDGAIRDATASTEGPPVTVSVKAGSGRSRVFVKAPSDAEATLVNHTDAGGIYLRPSFVRPRVRIPPPERPPIAALRIASGVTSPVLFLAAPAGSYAAPTPLPNAGTETPSVVRLLRLGNRYVLLTKTRLSFAEGDPEPPERPVAGDVTIPLGDLFATVLDAAYAPVGASVKILGDIPIYEFDADVRADRMTILATTTDGAALIDGPLVQDAVAATARTRIPWPRPLAAPAVHAAGDRVYLAMIESPGTATARVLVASLANR
jgi:hypothetical protein